MPFALLISVQEAVRKGICSRPNAEHEKHVKMPTYLTYGKLKVKPDGGLCKSMQNVLAYSENSRFYVAAVGISHKQIRLKHV